MVRFSSRVRPAVRLSLLAVALCGALAGCVVAPARGPYGGPVVVEAPPPPRVEIIGVAPFPGALWINGYWGWRGNGHVWVPGYWERPRPGYRWQPHAWERGDRGWRERPGRWYPG